MTCESYRLLILDVDGVLTDGTFRWNSNLVESKSFSFRDVNGISLAKRSGIEVAIVSGEDSLVTTRFAERFGVSHVVQGCKDKASAIKQLCNELSIDLSQVVFMGDDYQDREAMQICGLSACPHDAHHSAQEVASFKAKSNGGRGAVRELVDYLLLGSKL